MQQYAIEPIFQPTLRVVEFFSGMGGYRFALERTKIPFKVVQAYDMNDSANLTYQTTFNHTPSNRSIANLKASELDKFEANCWVMSPPCQPFTRGGLNLDHEDGRSAPLLNLIDILPQLKQPPTYFVLENVKNFENSHCRGKLVEALKGMGYSVHEFLVSPWQFGIPNQRLRYYLLATINKKASSQHLHTMWPLYWAQEETLKPTEGATCSQNLDGLKAQSCPSIDSVINEEANFKEEFLVPSKFLLKSHQFRFDILSSQSNMSSCFTKAYGSHHLFGSGSLFDPSTKPNSGYDFTSPSTLVDLNLRFFTPWEVAILHGVPVPETYYKKNDNVLFVPPWQFTQGTELKFPSQLTNIQKYRLLGNSLNPIVVARLMSLVFFNK